MPDETATEKPRSDAPSGNDSPFPDTPDDVAETPVEKEDSRGEAAQDPQGSEDAADTGDEASAAEELKVVVSMRGGRATIGVQQPSSDPHIESFDDHDLPGLAQEVPAVVERARAGWEEAPKHPAYERPAPPTRRRSRRQQGSAQASNVEGQVTETQQHTLRLF